MSAVRALASPKEEVLVPLEVGPSGKVNPVTLVRNALIIASVQAIKTSGHFDAYLTQLPPEFHKPVTECPSGGWLDYPLALAHYRAANALNLRTEDVLNIGRGVSIRIQETLLGTFVRLAKSAGFNLWTALEQAQRGWGRIFIGGSLAVYKLGPKDARYEVHGMPELADLAFYRQSHRGTWLGFTDLFAAKGYVHEISSFAASGVIAFRLSWV